MTAAWPPSPEWFPERRGLGSGLVVMGFGQGAFFHSHAMKGLSPDGVLPAFVGSGFCFAALGGLSAALLRDPRAASPGAPERRSASGYTGPLYPIGPSVPFCPASRNSPFE
ncbi:MAG TPA: hypothetical protein VFR85_16125 [Anaeromyxobacteraceae bacterium]|nr:hypothetical protein [Anaeromyxobacteraceae bacterium]